MRTVVTVPFTDDVLIGALDHVNTNCKVILPTKTSAGRARRMFMENWQLQECGFYSMEEWKNDLLLPNAPVVTDDKRMLCLYQCLIEEEREYFHLGSYFDIVDWGNHFFQFFEELADECYDPDDLLKLGDSGTFNLLDWQEKYLQRVMTIRARYKEMLAHLGFSDPIFFRNAKHFYLSGEHTRFIFVNQYYYSKLELELISKLESAGNEIVILFQTNASDIDPVKLRFPSIDLNKLETPDINTKKTVCIKCENEDQMVLTFLAEKHKLVNADLLPGVIIDSKFNQKHYKLLFDPEYYSYPQSVSMINTSLFDMLLIFQTHLNGMTGTIKQRYIPLRNIIDACSRDQFIRYYQPNWQEKDCLALRNELKLLAQEEILYVDKDLNILDEQVGRKNYPCLRELLFPHFLLLDRLSGVGSLEDLLELIDTENGIRISELCNAVELQYSNILEVFYERLANFISVDSLGLVSSWTGLLGSRDSGLAASILKLWLEFLSSARVRFVSSAAKQIQFDISNLLDCRDLNYRTVAFFHAIEGELPTNPSPVWLFNETQRGKLGLKTYQELRERERYYFLRMVFGADNVIILSYENQEKDIETGSFVSELTNYLQQEKSLNIDWKELNYSIDLSMQFAARKSILSTYAVLSSDAVKDSDCGFDQDKPEEFFVIPCEPETDFSKHEIPVSAYGLSAFISNPFTWYVEFYCALKTVQWRAKETIHRRLFGSLMHSFMSQVLQQLSSLQTGTEHLASVFGDQQFLRKTLENLLSDSIFLYKLPQNYNFNFLRSTISDCLIESIRQFYEDFLRVKLQNVSYTIIPEREHGSADEQLYKEFVAYELNSEVYKLMIKGKADLRIESSQENIIIDFKTGGHSVGQLLFYEYYYYLLDEDYNGIPFFSRFWEILNQQLASEKTDEKTRNGWRENSLQGLISCLTQGFTQGKKAADRAYLIPITRADLLRFQSGGAK
jgi:hypothetical protein